jgi:small subunit ribosomal protein S6
MRLRSYELLFITRPDYDDEKVASVISRYQDLITNANGTIQSAEKWGKRRLAYEINDLREGVYILINFQAGSKVASELDRLMKIDQDVVRHMISRIEHPERRVPQKAAQKAKPEEIRVEPDETAPPVKVVREATSESGASEPEVREEQGAQ